MQGELSAAHGGLEPQRDRDQKDAESEREGEANQKASRKKETGDPSQKSQRGDHEASVSKRQTARGSKQGQSEKQ